MIPFTGMIPFTAFTKPAQRAIDKAKAESRRSKGEKPGDLMMGIVQISNGVGGRALMGLGATTVTLRSQMLQQAHPLAAREEAKLAFERATEYAKATNSSHIGTHHLLLALIEDSDGTTVHALAALGISAEQVKREIYRLLATGVRE